MSDIRDDDSLAIDRRCPHGKVESKCSPHPGCPDFTVLFSVICARTVVKDWHDHYNCTRPDSDPGSGFPRQGPGLPVSHGKKTGIRFPREFE